VFRTFIGSTADKMQIPKHNIQSLEFRSWILEFLFLPTPFAAAEPLALTNPLLYR
jgi:hypothetical protein